MIIFIIPTKNPVINIENHETTKIFYTQEFKKNVNFLENDINNILLKKKNFILKIVVNRLEFVIYYLLFKSYVKYNNYKIYVVNKNINIGNIIFYYHKTIYEILYESYIILQNHIKKLSR
jgi:hypothetical protein